MGIGRPERRFKVKRKKRKKKITLALQRVACTPRGPHWTATAAPKVIHGVVDEQSRCKVFPGGRPVPPVRFLEAGRPKQVLGS